MFRCCQALVYVIIEKYIPKLYSLSFGRLHHLIFLSMLAVQFYARRNPFYRASHAAETSHVRTMHRIANPRHRARTLLFFYYYLYLQFFCFVLREPYRAFICGPRIARAARNRSSFQKVILRGAHPIIGYGLLLSKYTRAVYALTLLLLRLRSFVPSRLRRDASKLKRVTSL